MFAAIRTHWVNKIRTNTSRRCLLWSSIIMGIIIVCTFGVIFLILHEQLESKSKPLSQLNSRYIPISININSKNFIIADDKEVLYFASLGSADTILVNTGHSVQTTFQVDNVANATGGPFEDNIFIYISLEYYFISNNSNGVTGTTIDGKGFPYEFRILYRNSKYSTIDEAIKNQDGLAEHVLPINMCSTPNEDFDVLSKAFQNISEPGNSIVVPLAEHINPILHTYVGSNSSDYYSYLGSFSDTLTNQTYQCSTVFIFYDNSTGCITQEQFHNAFGTLKSNSGEPAAYTLPHDASEIKVSLNTNKGWIYEQSDSGPFYQNL